MNSYLTSRKSVSNDNEHNQTYQYVLLAMQFNNLINNWLKFFFLVKGDEVVMDLSKLFQSGVLEEFADIMSDSIKSMNINNTAEWWALRTRLDRRMKVTRLKLPQVMNVYLLLTGSVQYTGIRRREKADSSIT